MTGKRCYVLVLLVLCPALLFAQDPGNFSTSLHATRQGKATWYGAAQGGFERLTGVPMDSLSCQGCHAPTLADGTPIDPATYQPGCNDCHNFAQGTAVASETCLGCHSRQGVEINLSNNPILGPLFTDVHRTNGMGCTDCHSKREMHGDGTEYASMLAPGAMDASCTNEGCHSPAELAKNSAHNIHSGSVYCTACHAKTVISCYNCHFDTEIAQDKKRFYGPPPLNGFAMLVQDDERGMVTTATFQALAYKDTTFYAVGRFGPHTIGTKEETRGCEDCHNAATVQEYNATGKIPVVQWDASESKLVNTKGVIPVPPDWQSALEFDFVRYKGAATDPIDSPFDPTKWEFMKSGADTSQMLFASPLSIEQMQKLSMAVPSQDTFKTSLHYTRAGKPWWYSKENGGFETLTDIPMDSLPCQKCHAATLADGTEIDPETYEPSCSDCHDFSQGTAVAQSTCLGCHSRQGAEINLSAVNPIFKDVHRDAGMVCTDCHTEKEMHGDGTPYVSMLAEGATEVSCVNEGCHPTPALPANQAHNIHMDAVYCTACHAQTVATCYNCHFETEVQADKKRFYGPPPTGGFTLLVRRESDGKVTTASYQALTFAGKSFYAIGPFNGHTISSEARDCDECHDTEIVRSYTQSGEINLTQWDQTESKIVHAQGVIPVPPDWRQTLKLDFVTYTGEATDPTAPFDPTKWTFLKSGADTSQMLFAEPLTSEQMQKLATPQTAVEDRGGVLPDHFELLPNYPNPFNPGTTIEFHLPKTTRVTLKVYNILGGEVKTLLSKERRKAGVHRVRFEAGDLPSGVYLVRMVTPVFSQTRKITLLK